MPRNNDTRAKCFSSIRDATWRDTDDDNNNLRASERNTTVNRAIARRKSTPILTDARAREKIGEK